MKIQWENKYSIGIEKIDDQHKRLVDMLNKLITAGENKLQNSEIMPILQGLVNYTGYHFTTEELAMQVNNYSEYLIHKAKHDIFIKRVNDINSQFINGNSATLYYAIDFLKEWLIDHIMKEDKMYAPLMMGKM